jgi:hypothetical protein
MGGRSDIATITMIPEKHQQWHLVLDGIGIDTILLAFGARRIMRVTEQRAGLIEVKGGSALAVGKRARTLDWLPVRARISWVEDPNGYTQVEATVGPRGRPHIRRRLFAALYEQKLSSWLAELDRTLRASAKRVRDPDDCSAATGPTSGSATDPAT